MRKMTELKFDDKGLIPVVVQDWLTNEVLMVAWANAEAVELMKSTGYTHFWSRSRQKMWQKGEESGHVQKIKSIQVDCDADTLLVRVEQTGVACHLNKPSCFDEVIYGETDETMAIIPDLKRVIKDRHENPSDESYTCKLFNDETRMCKKVIEEAGEFALAIKDKDEDEMAWELADMIYHTMVAIEKTGLPMSEVYKKLKERAE
ncbi:MAG: bifunctional phosphoribosyl-AMP cyclohydrolase/phosphoribosyl-ATP diphosphatase HisIE [Candidatus Methanomethylophilaceae archaeon]|nr:bifunctional phosphoribosyl-AMP cyclohydrolase/phosphoribosyl-ATP diphosphatase HisIE [Candidatus Methanomethylophilaceae archaeon]